MNESCAEVVQSWVWVASAMARSAALECSKSDSHQKERRKYQRIPDNFFVFWNFYLASCELGLQGANAGREVAGMEGRRLGKPIADPPISDWPITFYQDSARLVHEAVKLYNVLHVHDVRYVNNLDTHSRNPHHFVV
jgi:hypothetical protein